MISYFPLLYILYLCVVFQLKHFLCDFPLQNGYMLGKFRDDGWVKPLAAHCAVHAVGTFLTLMTIGYAPAAWLGTLAGGLGGVKVSLYPGILIVCCVGLSAFDFACHFVMDRVKASSRLLGRYKSLTPGQYKSDLASIEYNQPHQDGYHSAKARLRSNKFFWWALGFDQMVHHFTHYAVILGYIAALVWSAGL